MTDSHFDETVNLDDMQYFLHVVAAGGFTGAARRLGVTKQTLSRRVAQLEQRLGVQLLHRTTRFVGPTEAGATYAQRCEEVVRLAQEADAQLKSSGVHDGGTPTGRLRVTADPHFAETFLVDVLAAYTTRFAEVTVELVATERHVDLIEEGFDVAFRVGAPPNSASLVCRRLGPANIAYCATPEYLRVHGEPTTAAQLRAHRCIVKATDGGPPPRWPMLGDRPVRGRPAVRMLEVPAAVLVNHQAIAQRLCLAGGGIALFPRFACRDHLRDGTLAAVLGELTPAVGDVHLLYHRSRHRSARVQRFVEVASEALGDAPWQ